MNFCTRCGNPRTPDAAACARCGQRFGEPRADAEPPTRADDFRLTYVEPHPTTWDYGTPGGWQPGPTTADRQLPMPPGFEQGTSPQPLPGYYDQPEPVPPAPGDPFWNVFSAPPAPPQLDPPGTSPPRSASPPLGAQLAAPRPRGGPGRRPRGTLLAAAALLILACGGGAYALVMFLTGPSRGSPEATSSQSAATGPSTSPAAQAGPRSPSAPPSAAPAASPAPPAPPSSTPPATVPPATTGPPGTAPPSTAPPQPAPPSGPVPLSVSAAALASPAEPAVADFVEQYFTAINSHDYQAYVSLLSTSQAAGYTSAKFDAGYGTTADSHVTLAGIADTGIRGEAVALTFTSHQAPSESVNHSSCTVWSITLYLSPANGSYLDEHPPAGYHASYESCS